MPPARLLVSTLLALALVAPRGARADEFDSQGVKIHYVVEGQGEPVVLVHGLYSSANMNWRLPGLIALLAKDYQVIAPDCRGHGESDKPEGEDDYGVKMSEDVVRLLDHLKIAKAHVVGYSMGGMIVMKLLATHPDRVKSAVLGGMGWLKAGGVLQKVWEHLGSRGDSMAPEGLVHSLGALAVTADEIKAIQVPTTMIVGDRDPVKRLYVDPAHEARPDWPMITVAGAGHLTCIAKQEFKDGVKAALDKQKGERKPEK